MGVSKQKGYSPELQIITIALKRNDVQRVISFLSVPVRFVMGDEADKVLDDTRKVLMDMGISDEDRLIGALRGSRL